MTDSIKERAKNLASDLLTAFKEGSQTPFYSMFLEALQAQDAESRKLQREACADAVAETVRELCASECLCSDNELSELRCAAHAACMNVEVKS